MTLEEFAEIESTATAAAVNVASGLRTFVRALNGVPAVRQLSEAARKKDDVASAVLARLIGLTKLRIDPRYENPNDVAIAAYLQVLSLAAPDVYDAAADAVTTARNCWWATQILEMSRPKQSAAQQTIIAVNLQFSEHLSTAKLLASMAAQSAETVVPLGAMWVDDLFHVSFPVSRFAVGQGVMVGNVCESVTSDESVDSNEPHLRFGQINSLTVNCSSGVGKSDKAA